MTSTGADRLTAAQIAAALVQYDGLVWQVAHYWHRLNPHLELEELYAEARAGFLEAMHRFEPSRGYAVPTYCRPWAVLRCRQYVYQQGTGGMHVPSQKGLLVLALVRLDAPPGDDARAPLRDLIEARPESEGYVARANFWAALGEGVLTTRERQVLCARFRDDRTFRDLGREMGLTRERVRQIEAGALAKLRDHPDTGLADELG